MTQEPVASRARTPHRVIAERVRELRKRRGWSGQRLGEELTAVGVAWDRSIVANFETGRRPAVSVEEWLALSYVLGVAPMHMLVPVDNRYVQVLPAPQAVEQPWQDTGMLDPRHVREWVAGQHPLRDADVRTYFSEVPEEEFRARFGRGSGGEPGGSHAS